MRERARIELEDAWKKDADGKEYYDEAASNRNLQRTREFVQQRVSRYTKNMDEFRP